MTSTKSYSLLFLALSTLMLFPSCTTATAPKYSGYLFAYFTGNGPDAESIHYALSEDGFTYKALNNNEPIIDSKTISTTGGVRDPHLLRSEDGKTFYMVVTDLHASTDGWSNHAMVLMKSPDLVHWTASNVNIPHTFSEYKDVTRVWAPQTIYDREAKKYMIYFSMLSPGGVDIIYYAYANKDFTGLESAPKQLFVSPTNKACIDGDIVYINGKYNLFFKTEGNGDGIKKAVSNKLTSGYVLEDRYLQQTTDAVEGSFVLKLIDTTAYLFMYDVYKRGQFQFTESTDLEHFKVIDNKVSLNFHPRHGAIIPITEEEMQRLIGKWGTVKDFGIAAAKAPQIKYRNIVIDDKNKTIYLPLKVGSDLTHLNPQFEPAYQAQITPQGAQDFSKGPVNYTLQLTGQQPQTFKVSAQININPILDGYYADPEVLYSNKTQKYYIYPTSDGFDGWSGNYFKCFSSTDLKSWNDEGVILDLPKDVSWGTRNAWAPTIAEQNNNGTYKYYYYFTAAQKIGVAVSDSPTGPFKDSGKPLVASFPDGIKGGQQIDPDVFQDPVSKKWYLYWGNGYLASAELGADRISLKKNTTKIMTPDATYREGTEVFYRKGKYYIMWSANDTRSPDYQVHYATATHPQGTLTLPANNLVIARDNSQQIYGTGHNCVIQIPHTDKWYIIYHRFTRPQGITMGDAAGFNREVCIDELHFDAQGNIIPVKPTL